MTDAIATTRCHMCGQPFAPRGLAVHLAMKHFARCRWRGANRGWCVTHDAEWRIDRAICEPREDSDD